MLSRVPASLTDAEILSPLSIREERVEAKVFGMKPKCSPLPYSTFMAFLSCAFVGPRLSVMLVPFLPEIIVATWRAARAHDEIISEADVREALHDIDPLWNELFPAEQARVLQLLVERVEVHPDGLDIKLRVDGLETLVSEIRGSMTEQTAA